MSRDGEVLTTDVIVLLGCELLVYRERAFVQTVNPVFWDVNSQGAYFQCVCWTCCCSVSEWYEWFDGRSKERLPFIPALKSRIVSP